MKSSIISSITKHSSETEKRGWHNNEGRGKAYVVQAGAVRAVVALRPEERAAAVEEQSHVLRGSAQL